MILGHDMTSNLQKKKIYYERQCFLFGLQGLNFSCPYSTIDLLC
jgi:hypothetical protein